MAAYWMVRINVTDAEKYGEYAKRAGPAIESHGGRYLTRGGRTINNEGTEYSRNVIVEFPSMDDAEACYNSPEYKEAMSYAVGAADRLHCIVEGV